MEIDKRSNLGCSELLSWLIFPHPARLHRPIDLKTFNKLLKESEVEVEEEGNPIGQELVFS